MVFSFFFVHFHYYYYFSFARSYFVMFFSFSLPNFEIHWWTLWIATQIKCTCCATACCFREMFPQFINVHAKLWEKKIKNRRRAKPYTQKKDEEEQRQRHDRKRKKKERGVCVKWNKSGTLYTKWNRCTTRSIFWCFHIVDFVCVVCVCIQLLTLSAPFFPVVCVSVWLPAQ